jgi:hypothetical protein
MDMRRLIDETDFDNLNELSKRWKKEPLPTSPPLSLSSSQMDDRPSQDRTGNIEKAPQKENVAQQSNTERAVESSYC